MWTTRRTEILQGCSEHVVIAWCGRRLSFADVIAAWRDSAEFRAFFLAELAATDFPAFFWEMPPVHQGNANRGYEYVAIRSDALAGLHPDASAFASELSRTSSLIASFRNLGGDALLLAPRQIGGLQSYGHLGAFVRSAPTAQQHALLRTLARAIALRIRTGRLWISTSGLGVPWLHVRIDSYPKYYNHRPYAEE